MFKICPECEQARHESEYGRRGKTNKLNSLCKDCNREYSKARYYESAKEVIRLRASNFIIKRSKRAFILEQKDKPCADCGHRFPGSAMDFDHVRGTKLFGLSDASHRRTYEEIQDEIDKCDVVCANCHRIRTQQRAKGRKRTNDRNEQASDENSQE